jgi:hypothetical protein
MSLLGPEADPQWFLALVRFNTQSGLRFAEPEIRLLAIIYKHALFDHPGGDGRS